LPGSSRNSLMPNCRNTLACQASLLPVSRPSGRC
jgi:hypothetical protein